MKSKTVSRPVKRLVRERAGSICEYCRLPDLFSSSPFVCEHILPRVKGGSDSLQSWPGPAQPATVINIQKPRLLILEPENSFRSSIPAVKPGRNIFNGAVTRS